MHNSQQEYHWQHQSTARGDYHAQQQVYVADETDQRT